MISIRQMVAGMIICGALAGCGKPTSSVSGRVLYEGKPVTGGEIYFFDADGDKETAKAAIKSDGTYILSSVLAGKKRVTAVAERPIPLRGADTKDEEPPPPKLEFPDDAIGQGKELELNTGANTFDLELKKPADH